MKCDQMRYAEAMKKFFLNLPTSSKFCFMIIHTPKSKTFIFQNPKTQFEIVKHVMAASSKRSTSKLM